MTPTTFFHLLHIPTEAKGDALAERIAALNNSAAPNVAGAAEETCTLDPAAFAEIPGEPYAYHWGLVAARKHLRELGAPEPSMPPFDESKFDPMPEVEINPDDEFHVDE